jgi:hypothetical protein
MKSLHTITRRRATIPVAGLLVAFALAGCSLLPAAVTPESPITQAPVVATIKAADLADTTWTGIDSAKIPTTFLFHADGSTAVKFGSKSYDDPGDTWAIDGNLLTVTIYNIQNEGDATYTGTLATAAGPVDLAIGFTLDDKARTLTVSKAGGTPTTAPAPDPTTTTAP